jgi:hypothetical protein
MGFNVLSVEGIAMSTIPHSVDAQGSQPVEDASVGQAASAPGSGEASRSEVSERRRQVIELPPRQDWREISDEEWRARHEEYKRAIAEIDAQDDTPEEVYDAVMRGIDEERRIQGRPPAFEGYY